MPEIKIEVPLLPPAEYSPNSRCHWAIKKKAGDAFGFAVYLLALEQKKSMIPFEKAEVSLTVIFKQNRRHDPDNFWTRFKPGMDALVRAGILKDDDTEHVKLGELNLVNDSRLAPLTIITIKNIKG
uniref:Uncharacterized protein n=1 Tax=viral metagenome TaxID=1070528 RepID=A0A6M3LSS4_9ZZZZ